MSPVVSICMPHLNSGRFVHDRMRSILSQTFEDWELVIVDSGSDDGSLQTLQGFAAEDPRIRLQQAPRDGIYTNINRAIEQSCGRFIYLATSDDTMAPDCLERMMAALEEHPECGLAHCNLSIIDEYGGPVPPADGWDRYESRQFFGGWMEKPHVRRAPHDGLLHFRYFTVYTSLTQLLVRREVYERIGLFRTDSDSYADFAWGMRAGLVENVLHVPGATATWRRHERQATNSGALVRARASGEFVRLARETTQWLEAFQPELATAICSRGLLHYYLFDQLEAINGNAHPVLTRIRLFLGFCAHDPGFAAASLGRKLIRLGRPRRQRVSIERDIRALMPEGGLVEAKAARDSSFEETSRAAHRISK